MTTPRRQLVFISVVQVLAMATWFSASAVVPALLTEWGISQTRATWLTASVQLGFVTGAVLSAVVNLPDRVPAHRLVAVCSLVAAGTTITIAVAVNGLTAAVVLRFLTGVALAGVYPPGLRLMASWFDRGRGLALGILVGALALGSALPQLVTSFAGLPWRGVLLVAGALALLGAVIALWRVRPGPLAAPAPPLNPRYVVTLFRDRGPRLANLGYLGHMWELYAMWTWLPAYLAASYAAHGTWGGSRTAVGLSAFLAIGVAGVAGCLIGGWFGDRFGRARTAAWAMATSATCCLLAMFVYGLHPLLVIVVLVVWGASVIADSALFSTCLTQVVDPRYVGTALTAQTAAGFLLTTVTIQAVPYVADHLSWPVAVAALGLGPAVGAYMMGRLHRHLAATASATTVEAVI
ncbi:MAG TPA: MFS transporter [Micromonosporaceae bacterium]|nr:MFS transporter [Micromonosporaceae bacterium]